jgi:hypothetical protein
MVGERRFHVFMILLCRLEDRVVDSMVVRPQSTLDQHGCQEIFRLMHCAWGIHHKIMTFNIMMVLLTQQWVSVLGSLAKGRGECQDTSLDHRIAPKLSDSFPQDLQGTCLHSAYFLKARYG